MRVFRSNEFLQSIPNSSKILGLNATPEYEKSPAKKYIKKLMAFINCEWKNIFYMVKLNYNAKY